MTAHDPTQEDGETLTAELAQRYLDQQNGDETPPAVDLDLVRRITPEGAATIARHPHYLAFPAVESIDDSTAIALGTTSATLDFSGLKSLDGLSDEALRALGRGGKNEEHGWTSWLYLNGLSTISATQLALLAEANRHLSLDGIPSFDRAAWQALSDFTGGLSLNGLASLAIDDLADGADGGEGFSSLSLNGLPSIDAALARSLVCRVGQGSLSLAGLTELDEETAEALSECQGRLLDLDGLTSLTARQAAYLARYRGRDDSPTPVTREGNPRGSLRLSGLGSLSDEAIAALAARQGDLHLSGLTALSRSAAQSLSRHQGGLSLNGLTDVDPELVPLLVRHRGSLGLEGLSWLAPQVHASLVTGRSVDSTRDDGTEDEDFLFMGVEGELNWAPVRLAADGPEVPRALLAVAHRLQQGHTETFTLRQLLGWFDAQRRGRQVLERIETAIRAIASVGYPELDALRALINVDDLDAVLTLPPRSDVPNELAEALSEPMLRLGYVALDGSADSARFQSSPDANARTTLTIQRMAVAPLILQMSVTVDIPDDSAALALAVATVNRINRRAFVGRMHLDAAARQVRYDVLGAVDGLSAVKVADAADGVLPRLLNYIVAAERLLLSDLCDRPVKGPPNYALDAVELANDESALPVMVHGSSLRTADSFAIEGATLSAAAPLPPRIDPRLVGSVIAANGQLPSAKAYLSRDPETVEKVLVAVAVAVIVTDATIVPAVAEWINNQATAGLETVRQALVADGFASADKRASKAAPKLDSIDAILGALDEIAAEGDGESERDSEDSEDEDDESEWDNEDSDGEEDEEQESEDAGGVSAINALAVSPLGDEVIVASADKRMNGWRVPQAHPSGRDESPGIFILDASGFVEPLEGVDAERLAVTWSPDGCWLAAGLSDGTVELVESEGVWPLKGHSDWVRAVAFSPDGTWLVSGSDDGTARIWDFAERSERRVLEPHPDWVRAVAVSPDGQRIATGCDDGRVRLWRVADGALETTLAGHEGWVTCLAFAPDGARLVSGGQDKSVRVWRMSDGAVQHSLCGHSDCVRAVAVHPDGSTIASAGDDRALRLWDMATGRLQRNLLGATGALNAVAFTPDGAQVVAGGADATIRFWELASGRIVHTTGHLDLQKLERAAGLILPDRFAGEVWLDGLESAAGLNIPQGFRGVLRLNGLASAEYLVVPEDFAGSISLSGLESAADLTLPKPAGGGQSISLSLPSNLQNSVELPNGISVDWID